MNSGSIDTNLLNMAQVQGSQGEESIKKSILDKAFQSISESVMKSEPLLSSTSETTNVAKSLPVQTQNRNETAQEVNEDLHERLSITISKLHTQANVLLSAGNIPKRDASPSTGSEISPSLSFLSPDSFTPKTAVEPQNSLESGLLSYLSERPDQESFSLDFQSRQQIGTYMDTLSSPIANIAAPISPLTKETASPRRAPSPLSPPARNDVTVRSLLGNFHKSSASQSEYPGSAPSRTVHLQSPLNQDSASPLNSSCTSTEWVQWDVHLSSDSPTKVHAHSSSPGTTSPSALSTRTKGKTAQPLPPPLPPSLPSTPEFSQLLDLRDGHPIPRLTLVDGGALPPSPPLPTSVTKAHGNLSQSSKSVQFQISRDIDLSLDSDMDLDSALDSLSTSPTSPFPHSPSTSHSYSHSTSTSFYTGIDEEEHPSLHHHRPTHGTHTHRTKESKGKILPLPTPHPHAHLARPSPLHQRLAASQTRGRERVIETEAGILSPERNYSFQNPLPLPSVRTRGARNKNARDRVPAVAGAPQDAAKEEYASNDGHHFDDCDDTHVPIHSEVFDASTTPPLRAEELATPPSVLGCQSRGANSAFTPDLPSSSSTAPGTPRSGFFPSAEGVAGHLAGAAASLYQPRSRTPALSPARSQVGSRSHSPPAASTPVEPLDICIRISPTASGIHLEPAVHLPQLVETILASPNRPVSRRPAAAPYTPAASETGSSDAVVLPPGTDQLLRYRSGQFQRSLFPRRSSISMQAAEVPSFVGTSSTNSPASVLGSYPGEDDEETPIGTSLDSSSIDGSEPWVDLAPSSASSRFSTLREERVEMLLRTFDVVQGDMEPRRRPARAVFMGGSNGVTNGTAADREAAHAEQVLQSLEEQRRKATVQNSQRRKVQLLRSRSTEAAEKTSGVHRKSEEGIKSLIPYASSIEGDLTFPAFIHNLDKQGNTLPSTSLRTDSIPTMHSYTASIAAMFPEPSATSFEDVPLASLESSDSSASPSASPRADKTTAPTDLSLYAFDRGLYLQTRPGYSAAATEDSADVSHRDESEAGLLGSPTNVRSNVRSNTRLDTAECVALASATKDFGTLHSAIQPIGHSIRDYSPTRQISPPPILKHLVGQVQKTVEHKWLQEQQAEEEHFYKRAELKVVVAPTDSKTTASEVELPPVHPIPQLLATVASAAPRRKFSDASSSSSSTTVSRDKDISTTESNIDKIAQSELEETEREGAVEKNNELPKGALAEPVKLLSELAQAHSLLPSMQPFLYPTSHSVPPPPIPYTTDALKTFASTSASTPIKESSAKSTRHSLPSQPATATTTTTITITTPYKKTIQSVFLAASSPTYTATARRSPSKSPTRVSSTAATTTTNASEALPSPLEDFFPPPIFLTSAPAAPLSPASAPGSPSPPTPESKPPIPPETIERLLKDTLLGPPPLQTSVPGGTHFPGAGAGAVTSSTPGSQPRNRSFVHYNASTLQYRFAKLPPVSTFFPAGQPPVQVPEATFRALGPHKFPAYVYYQAAKASALPLCESEQWISSYLLGLRGNSANLDEESERKVGGLSVLLFSLFPSPTRETDVLVDSLCTVLDTCKNEDEKDARIVGTVSENDFIRTPGKGRPTGEYKAVKQLILQSPMQERVQKELQKTQPTQPESLMDVSIPPSSHPTSLSSSLSSSLSLSPLEVPPTSSAYAAAPLSSPPLQLPPIQRPRIPLFPNMQVASYYLLAPPSALQAALHLQTLRLRYLLGEAKFLADQLRLAEQETIAQHVLREAVTLEAMCAPSVWSLRFAPYALREGNSVSSAAEFNQGGAGLRGVLSLQHNPDVPSQQRPFVSGDYRSPLMLLPPVLENDQDKSDDDTPSQLALADVSGTFVLGQARNNDFAMTSTQTSAQRFLSGTVSSLALTNSGTAGAVRPMAITKFASGIADYGSPMAFGASARGFGQTQGSIALYNSALEESSLGIFLSPSKESKPLETSMPVTSDEWSVQLEAKEEIQRALEHLADLDVHSFHRSNGASHQHAERFNVERAFPDLRSNGFPTTRQVATAAERGLNSTFSLGFKSPFSTSTAPAEENNDEEPIPCPYSVPSVLQDHETVAQLLPLAFKEELSEAIFEKAREKERLEALNDALQRKKRELEKIVDLYTEAGILPILPPASALADAQANPQKVAENNAQIVESPGASQHHSNSEPESTTPSGSMLDVLLRCYNVADGLDLHEHLFRSHERAIAHTEAFFHPTSTSKESQMSDWEKQKAILLREAEAQARAEVESRFQKEVEQIRENGATQIELIQDTGRIQERETGFFIDGLQQEEVGGSLLEYKEKLRRAKTVGEDLKAKIRTVKARTQAFQGLLQLKRDFRQAIGHAQPRDIAAAFSLPVNEQANLDLSQVQRKLTLQDGNALSFATFSEPQTSSPPSRPASGFEPSCQPSAGATDSSDNADNHDSARYYVFPPWDAPTPDTAPAWSVNLMRQNRAICRFLAGGAATVDVAASVKKNKPVRGGEPNRIDEESEFSPIKAVDGIETDVDDGGSVASDSTDELWSALRSDLFSKLDLPPIPAPGALNEHEDGTSASLAPLASSGLEMRAMRSSFVSHFSAFGALTSPAPLSRTHVPTSSPSASFLNAYTPTNRPKSQVSPTSLVRSLKYFTSRKRNALVVLGLEQKSSTQESAILETCKAPETATTERDSHTLSQTAPTASTAAVTGLSNQAGTTAAATTASSTGPSARAPHALLQYHLQKLRPGPIPGSTPATTSNTSSPSRLDQTSIDSKTSHSGDQTGHEGTTNTTATGANTSGNNSSPRPPASSSNPDAALVLSRRAASPLDPREYRRYLFLCHVYREQTRLAVRWALTAFFRQCFLYAPYEHGFFEAMKTLYKQLLGESGRILHDEAAPPTKVEETK